MRGRGTIAVGLVAAAVAGCGGGEAAQTPEDAVRATLATFTRAVQDKEYATLCDDVFSKELTDSLGEVGLTCEQTMEQAFGDVRSPQLSVDDVTVDGTDATATVRTSALEQEPSTDTVRLVEADGGWRVTALGGG
jgi:hypothetical protein